MSERKETPKAKVSNKRSTRVSRVETRFPGKGALLELSNRAEG
jgi:hypothetical protein